jgi:hypothetical protein
MNRRRFATVAAGLGLALVLAGCSDDAAPTADPAPEAASSSPSVSPEAHTGHDSAGPAPKSRPLRQGERFSELAMPAAYSPSAPNGVGTDDYRCFLLDPELKKDSFITGIDVLPGNEDVVHHVILFRVPPASIAKAESKDAQEDGQGWTCFGGTGLESGGGQLDDAPWLGAWAPGGGERVMAKDVGIPLEAGTQVIMQVHYNLLAGQEPDVSAARLRLASGAKDLAALQTMLLPAPVELPCRPGHDAGALCTREAALADNTDRFGYAAQTANALHILCGTDPPGPVQHCDRKVQQPTTIRAVAGHMHLLGRKIRIDVNPGTPQAQTVLDIPVWDFDDQGSRPVDPVALEPGDTVRVTCRHDQSLRDLLPAFEGQPDRYVVWGEGTTDEMCLGMLMVTRP